MKTPTSQTLNNRQCFKRSEPTNRFLKAKLKIIIKIRIKVLLLDPILNLRTKNKARILARSSTLTTCWEISPAGAMNRIGVWPPNLKNQFRAIYLKYNIRALPTTSFAKSSAKELLVRFTRLSINRLRNYSPLRGSTNTRLSW